MNTKVRTIIIAIVCICLIGGVVCWKVSKYKKFKSANKFSQTVKTSPAAEFTLTNQDGTKAGLSDYRGKLIVMLFGYTFCPDVCPMELTQMEEVMEKLGDQAKQLQVLFITLDPERDTPKVLKNYLAYFHPSFVGLTGTMEEIDKVARDYKINYMKREGESESDYFMGHSTTVYLIDQKGNITYTYAAYSKMTFWEQMGEDIKELL